jgi:hypothetical protein
MRMGAVGSTKPKSACADGAKPGDHELIEEVESLAFWANEKLAKLDTKLRTSISATLNGACSMFDVPVLRRAFAPEPEDMKGRREFIGFREALQRGYVVSLRIPGTQYKSVSNVVRTLMKLNFFDAVLERLADLRPGARADGEPAQPSLAGHERHRLAGRGQPAVRRG